MKYIAFILFFLGSCQSDKPKIIDVEECPDSMVRANKLERDSILQYVPRK